MNGRIYDPLLGRMLSADVLVTNPSSLQAFNRYSYVNNNPLTLTDPSGFEPMGFVMMTGFNDAMLAKNFGSQKMEENRQLNLEAAKGTIIGGVGVVTGALLAPVAAGVVASTGATGATATALGIGADAGVGAVVGMAQQGTANALNGKPLGENLGTAAKWGAVGGAAISSVSRAVGAIWNRLVSAAPKTGAAPEVNPTKAPSTIKQNAEQGKAFEKVVGDGLKKTDTDVASQVTVKTQSGVSTKIDFASKGPDGTINLTEAKSSATAPLTKNQAAAFPEIEQTGGVVTGKGKPGFEGGTEIPPTKVKIVRPKAPGEPSDGS